MARFVPVDTTFGQVARPSRFVPVGARGASAPGDPVGAGLELARNLASFGRTGMNLVDLAGDTPSPFLREGAASLGTITGLADVARAVTDERSTDLQRARNAARGAIGATRAFTSSPTVRASVPGASSVAASLNGGVSLGTNAAGSAAGVPYVDMALGAFDIASIADSNADDDRKAYDAAGAVGRTVANAFLPVVGGLMAGGIHEGVGAMIFGQGYYDRVRRNDARAVGANMRRYLGAIDGATTEAELDEAVAALGLGDGGGGVRYKGARFDTPELNAQLSGAIEQRRALIAAAAANPNGPEAAKLAEINAVWAPRKQALDYLVSIDKNAHGGRAWLMGEYAIAPEGIEDRVLERLNEWTGNLRSFRAADEGRTPADAPHVVAMRQGIADLTGAAQALGMDLAGAAARKRARDQEQANFAQSMSSIGGL
ncbi:MAG TPA: hypothetical protein VEA38_00320 [Terriglobales bacterium]|nr:hypothetical protein [Terriglobales bacterium]